MKVLPSVLFQDKEYYVLNKQPSYQPKLEIRPLKGELKANFNYFCIDVNIRWINFTALIYIDDEWF